MTTPEKMEFFKARNEEIGRKLIEVLGLRVKANGRVDTAWGDKTPRGLAATVRRVIAESGEETT